MFLMIGQHHDVGFEVFTACYLLHGGFLLGLFFKPEDQGDKFLQSIS
jgi:hypothetical protein